MGRLISPSCPQTVRRPRPRTPIANGRPPILALASQAVPHHYATRGWLCRGDIFVRRPTRYRTQRGSEGKGELCGFEYPATGQDYLPYMTKWVRSDQFVTLFVKAAHQPYLPDRVPWVVVLFARGLTASRSRRLPTITAQDAVVVPDITDTLIEVSESGSPLSPVCPSAHCCEAGPYPGAWPSAGPGIRPRPGPGISALKLLASVHLIRESTGRPPSILTFVQLLR